MPAAGTDGHRRGAERYFALSLGAPGRFRLVADLEAAGARLVTEASVVEVAPDHVVTSVGGEEEMVPADTVIGVAAVAPPSPLADALAEAGWSVHLVGDARSLAFIEGATSDALDVALALG